MRTKTTAGNGPCFDLRSTSRALAAPGWAMGVPTTPRGLRGNVPGGRHRQIDRALHRSSARRTHVG